MSPATDFTMISAEHSQVSIVRLTEEICRISLAMILTETR